MSSEARLVLWWKTLFAVIAVGSPLIVFTITSLLIEGRAREEYFEAVAQILPVLLLALAIEQRYFTRRPPPIPESPIELELAGGRLDDQMYALAVKIHALLVLALLGMGEWIAVEVLATGESSVGDLKITGGSLAAGFTALIVSALVGTKQTTD